MVYNFYWHADDVRDFTFRTFLPKSVAITQTTYTSFPGALLDLNKLDLTTSIATVPYSLSDPSGFNFRNNWFGNGL